VEVTESGKHSSLLQYNITITKRQKYDRKIFGSVGPKANRLLLLVPAFFACVFGLRFSPECKCSLTLEFDYHNYYLVFLLTLLFE
jgi:hypothetical protein